MSREPYLICNLTGRVVWDRVVDADGRKFVILSRDRGRDMIWIRRCNSAGQPLTDLDSYDSLNAAQLNCHWEEGTGPAQGAAPT